ncbi:MAG: phosphate-starvation-inducible PsiE family protein [Oceanipulchritudo sp.]
MDEAENRDAGHTPALDLLRKGESLLYWCVAILLGTGAFILVGWAIWDFIIHVSSDGVERAALVALDDLLLVIMLAEIIHTVGISLRRGVLVVEPFLIVGVIAAVRRMLIITAELAVPEKDQTEIFRLMMLELGILTLTILALSFGIYLLRRKNGPQESEDR